MKRPYILSENNWKNIKDSKFELAVLTWGATEAHNYHLPYGTDNIEGTAFAEEAARIAWKKGAKLIVLPTIPFGVNTGQTDIYLDMNMRPSTQKAVLADILTVLNRQGIKKFLLLNSHGGNNWKSIFRELGLDFPQMFLGVCEWYRAVDNDAYFDIPGDHAGELETSLLLHLRPDLVLPKSDWGDGREKKNKIEAFNQGWAWTERPWSKITEDTGVGDPSAASAEKGKRYFEKVSRKMADLFVQLCDEDTDSLYQ
jgi:creatinine amidohydrolase